MKISKSLERFTKFTSRKILMAGTEIYNVYITNQQVDIYDHC